jgi:hypothetical protein
MLSSMATGTADKVRENRLRDMARRQRAGLHKSRRRDPRAWDYGRWWIELHDGTEIGYADGWAGLTLEQVEAWLAREPDAV